MIKRFCAKTKCSVISLMLFFRVNLDMVDLLVRGVKEDEWFVCILLRFLLMLQ